ncbi:hypothetical protein B0T22DRAFT_437250 [Podospora appendiculata]|uniref:RBR-type E3 ubiquitin transferase n=1 Tax=Podospora appendiculata TaxID=314037 RepID=A0AAE0XJ56_9PEZI|nr:hypothetical protein B0T22DRAFT_437250 [Podospora appendiculata]
MGRRAAPAPAPAECASCGVVAEEDGPAPTLLTINCKHIFCRNCLAKFFRAALWRSVWPRCCKKRIELSPDIAAVLTAEERDLLLDADYDLNWQHNRHTYCAAPRCSALIAEKDVVGRVGTCKACGLETCLGCQRPHHSGRCRLDGATHKTLALAKAKGWKQCPHCRTLIEYIDGCRTMQCLTCRCSFCYRCARVVCNCRWPSCLVM